MQPERKIVFTSFSGRLFNALEESGAPSTIAKQATKIDAASLASELRSISIKVHLIYQYGNASSRFGVLDQDGVILEKGTEKLVIQKITTTDELVDELSDNYPASNFYLYNRGRNVETYFAEIT